ncbi:hypothetical protein CMI47_06405 [Candidatus Pacearchaeota archaeon]|nr:hypothetical protein [Candidatus Pacearchaeota archaeon]|tara:strand:+ start:2679 stop:3554 length:876 start_codon:yes stop_codon:yes gene_type:complete
MLPDNFDFAMLPPGEYNLEEIGMLASSIETMDYAMNSWLQNDLNLSARTNEGFTKVPVLWQTPERAYQVKHDKNLRDDAGALKLPLISIERTGVIKDPARKGSFQAQIYSNNKNGRTGRWVIARRIVEDKTRNFAVAGNTRQAAYTSGSFQQYSPRVNKKIVIQSLSIPIPVYVNVEYKILIKTEYQEQMNSLIQPFMARTGQVNAFVLRRSGHLYEGFIDQGFTHTNNIANLGEDLRMFSSEIKVRLLGYLIGEGENDDRPLVRIDENVVEYVFPSESVVPEDNDDFFLP